MLGCSICQDGINENPTDKNYPWVLSCGHIYHKLCIDRSLNLNNNCPQCRKPVTKSFRLFPEVLNGCESFTFLQECVQSAETQYERQKKVCQERDSVIRGLQNALEDTESKNTELRTSYIIYTNANKIQTEKLNAEIKTLQNDKNRLNEDLNYSAGRVVRLQSIIGDLKALLHKEKDAVYEYLSNIIAGERKIDILKLELEKVKQDGLALERVRVEEINQLRAKLNQQQIEITSAKETIEDLPEREPSAARDPAVDGLAQDLQRITLPPSRKRRNNDEGSYSPWFSATEETSVKQQKSESGGDDASPREGATTEQSGGVAAGAGPGEAECPAAAAAAGERTPPTTRTRRRVRKVLRVVKE